MSNDHIVCRFCDQSFPLSAPNAKEVICPFCRHSMPVEPEAPPTPTPPDVADRSVQTAPEPSEPPAPPPTRFEPSEVPRWSPPSDSPSSQSTSGEEHEIVNAAIVSPPNDDDVLLPPPAHAPVVEPPVVEPPVVEPPAVEPPHEVGSTDALLPPPSPTSTTDASSDAEVVTATLVEPPEKLADGSVLIRGEDGQVVALQEPRKIVKRGSDEIELRRLTTEEKEKRRFVKSVIVWLFCAIVLAGSLAALLSL